METNDPCSGCGQKKTCRDAYEKLGKATGPNVCLKVIVAFLVPILVFILSLAGAETLLAGRFEGRLLTLFSFLSAFGTTFLFVLIIRTVRGPIQKEDCTKRQVS